MKIWKALGLAGLAGVAATGVIIARDQRSRAQLTPEQVKDRLHERLAASQAGAAAATPGPAVPAPPRRRRLRWPRHR